MCIRDSLIPGSDVIAAKISKRPEGRNTRGRISSGIGSGAASRATQRDALMVLRKIFIWARGEGLTEGDPVDGVLAMKPVASRAITPVNKEAPRPFTFKECELVASHLHIHHQMVMWIQRILGLRVSEVYGINVEDIIDLGTRGAITLEKQGGKAFWVRGADDQIIKVNAKTAMKTSSSRRIMVAPTQLMEMMRVYLRAFHMDPDTAEVNPKARFIVGLRDPQSSGSAAYGGALKNAYESAGLGFKDVGFRASTHHLRKSMATDVDMLTDISKWLHSLMLGHAPKGHDGGADITRRVYILKSERVVEPLVKAAEELERIIDDSGCSLLTPSRMKPQYSRDHYLREERWQAHVEEVLAESGLSHPGEVMLTIAEAASRLGVTRRKLSELVRENKITATKVDQPLSSEPRYLIDPQIVEAELERSRSRISITEAAEELGTLVWPIYRAVKSGRLESTREGKRIYVERAALEEMREELLGSAALQERSMSSFEAAKVLKVGSGTIRNLRKRGVLETDPESPRNSACVTRTSVEAELARLKPRRSQREFDLTKMVTLQEAKALTGLAHNALMKLANDGVAIRRQDRKVYVDRVSLETWLEARER